MIPWIQVYSNLIRHPKVTKLADKLNLTSKDAGPNVIAAGMLVSLWLWAAQNATDGDLSECSDRAIAEAAEFKRKPSLFVEGLIYAKLLDEDRLRGEMKDFYGFAAEIGYNPSKLDEEELDGILEPFDDADKIKEYLLNGERLLSRRGFRL